MTIGKSLSDKAIEEFASSISNDSTLSEDLRNDLLRLISNGTWKETSKVSAALDAFHSGSEGAAK